MKNNRKLKRAVTISDKKEMENDVSSLEAQAKVKAGTHFKASDVAINIASDEELKVGRVRNSTKAMDIATERFNKAMTLVLEANDHLLNETKRMEIQSKKACASVKSTVNEIKDQLIKVDSILGDNVEHKIKQLERVAFALKTINELSGDNKTMNIVSAMVNKS